MSCPNEEKLVAYIARTLLNWGRTHGELEPIIYLGHEEHMLLRRHDIAGTELFHHQTFMGYTVYRIQTLAHCAVGAKPEIREYEHIQTKNRTSLQIHHPSELPRRRWLSNT